MKHAHVRAALALVALTAGCSATTREGKPAVVAQQDDLMDQAAYQMSCPRGSLTVARVSTEYTAAVEGCGKKALYKHVFGAGWVENTTEAKP